VPGFFFLLIITLFRNRGINKNVDLEFNEYDSFLEQPLSGIRSELMYVKNRTYIHCRRNIEFMCMSLIETGRKASL
jgi:hypothetical protein